MLEVVVIVPDMDTWYAGRYTIFDFDIPQKRGRYEVIITDHIRVRAIPVQIAEEKLRGLKINVAFIYYGAIITQLTWNILAAQFRDNTPIVHWHWFPEQIQKELIILLGKGGPGTPRTWQEYVERNTKHATR